MQVVKLLSKDEMRRKYSQVVVMGASEVVVMESSGLTAVVRITGGAGNRERKEGTTT